MIQRNMHGELEAALARQPAVALIGPRQVGKTTLALQIAKSRPSIRLDLESYIDRASLSDPIQYFQQNEDKLIILDEIHRMPELFQTLRVVIDQGRQKGIKTGRFLILGSASMDILKQSGESLAGRIAYVDMHPISMSEIEPQDLMKLWIRGGFPESFLAVSEEASMRMRTDFIRSYLEREIPQFAPKVASESLEKLWVMLAYSHGTMLNVSRLAASLTMASKSVTHYIDLLVDLLMVRRLKPYHANVSKRLVKASKLYIRDSGLLHALLNINSYNELSRNPIIGESFEGFAIENIVNALPFGARAYYYRTQSGAEIDLVIETSGLKKWAIEIKSGLVAKPNKGFYEAIKDIESDYNYVVYAGERSYPISGNIQAISLNGMLEKIRDINK